MADMTAFRDNLRRHPYYLGGDDVLERVIWKKIGNDNTLVAADEAAAYDDAVQSATEDGNDNPTVADLDPATFTLVASIDPDDFWLTPCGFWKGPTLYTASLADLKLSCRLVAPEDAAFEADFKTVLKNVERLMGRAATGGNMKQGILGGKAGTKPGLKLRHVVFEANSSGDMDDDPGAYQLRDWPVKSAAAQEALEKMDAENSHRVNPIPAYDIDGNLIHPTQYTSALKGAVVRADITLLHWHIVRETRDSYAAEISSLRVLVPPPNVGSNASPRKKRRVLAATDSGASPVKRVRGSEA
ncbi:hypothetical protein C8R46DRAFT_1207045 [Mycena filopes]|nr:hypothetical protein C8R46DRAFT_1207045 [Mycena filopes]